LTGEIWLALALALALDVVYPEHRGLLLRIHPVHTSYFMALRLAKRRRDKLWGIVVWLAVEAAHLAPFAALLALAAFHPMAWVLAAAATLKFSLSYKLLVDICRRAQRALERGDLAEARRWVSYIVRRDVSSLDKAGVASAALESLAESLVDGFTSPVFYAVLLGPLGAMGQRVANTLDGALGFKTPEFKDVGWASARADTVLNFIPARLTALLIALLAPIVGGDARKALAVWLRWRNATESLNAGHPMSAMAGALGVRLEKRGHYVLNPSGRPPTATDIARGIKLATAVAAVYLAVMFLIWMIVQYLKVLIFGGP